jgi:16S rRNA (guanine527-N7)-methyltransferase
VAAWLDLLVAWNARVDLTAARGPDELVDLALADAIVVAAQLPRGARVVDVGAGAGAPGLSLALLRDDIAMTLVEPLQKRVAFMRAVAGTTGRQNVEIVRVRAQDLAAARARGRELRAAAPRFAPFDVAISRATLVPQEWLELGTKLVTLGGSVWVLLARDLPPAVAGWRPVSDTTYRWPLTGAERRAVRYQR